MANSQPMSKAHTADQYPLALSADQPQKANTQPMRMAISSHAVTADQLTVTTDQCIDGHSRSVRTR
jgi:hypothetical protein